MTTHLRCKDFPNNLAAYRRNQNKIQFLILGGIETVISSDIRVLARRPHGCIFTECNINKLTSTIWMSTCWGVFFLGKCVLVVSLVFI